MAIVEIENEVGGIEVVNDAWLTATRTFYDALANVENRLTYDQTEALDQLLRSMGGGLTAYDVEYLIALATAPLILRIEALEAGTPPQYPYLQLSLTGDNLVLTNDPSVPSFILN